jgi:tetratricopeptide (TPR) repeat protein
MGIRGVLSKILIIMQDCNKPIEWEPKIALSWNLKGFALSSRGKYDEAIEAYDKAIELAPEWKVPWYNKRIALQKLSCHKKAEINMSCDPRREILVKRATFENIPPEL